MSGFDQSHNGAFFNFNNLTPQQLNMLRQQSQMQQTVQMPQQQQPQPQPQPPPGQQTQMQQRNPMMPQLGLPAGFNQQQLQALMAQQQSQLANGMMTNNQNPLMQMMRPQSMVQHQTPQQQMQPQQPQPQMQQQQQHLQMQNQLPNQPSSVSQPAHPQQQPQLTNNMGAAPQMGGLGGPTPSFAQLSHAIEQAKKGNLTQEQMIQLRQLITRQQAMQAQQQAAQNQNTGARPLQPGQPNINVNSMSNGQNFANAMQRTPQMQAQAQMMAGLQQVRPGQSTPTMGSQGFLQPAAPSQQPQQQQQPQPSQQQSQLPNQIQSSPQVMQAQAQMARSQTPQQALGLPQNAQQAQMMGQQPAQPGQQRPPVGRPDPSPGASNQQNPLNFLRLLHQRVTDIESKLNSDLSAEERQLVQQQHAEAKRLQSALLQRLNVQNAQQFAALMQQGQQTPGQAPNSQQHQPQQPSQQSSQPQQQQQQQQQQAGLGMMGNNIQSSPVVRPPARPGSARPPQGQFGSPMLNQPGPQAQNQQQMPPQQQTPQVRPSPQMGAMNMAGQPGMSGLQGVPSLRPEQFMKALVDLMKKRGTPITSLPKVGGRELDLYRFYQIVQAHGGSEGAHQKGAWPAIAMSLELAPLGSPQTQALGQALATEYRNYLAPFEETWQRAMQHQYQMSMAGAGLGQAPGAAQTNPQAPSFRPPSTPQMQSQQPNQQLAQLQGQQTPMMTPNPLQQQQQQQQHGQMQAQNAGVAPQQPSLAGFNPPPPPILSAENLAKAGMSQEQFNKAYLAQQLNAWRQEQLQNQQRQMNAGFQGNQAASGQNGMQQPAQSQQAQQQLQQTQQGPSQPTPQPGWPSQQRSMMPQTSGAQPSQTQPVSFGGNMPGQPNNAHQMQNQPSMGPNLQGQQQGASQQSQQQPSGMPSQSAQPPQTNAQVSSGPNGAGAPQGQQGQVAGRPSNMSQARFIAVSPEQLEQARAAMQKIDQELATQRPRLPIIQNIADDERDQILDQVQKLAPIQATVTALLPAFYAMNGNLEPAKRLKIMAFMYKDQFDLLPKKQCILRLADLDKLKMQMSRCISFVRSSNPDLAQRIVTSLGEQTRAAQQNGVVPTAPALNASAPQSTSQGTGANATQSTSTTLPAAGATNETANAQAQGTEAAAGVNADGTFDAAAAMHGIKRGLRPENLKLPPSKRAKNVVGGGKAMSPSSGANESPKVAPSPVQAEDATTPAGSTPAGKGGKKAEKTVKGGKATAKKGKGGAAGTPTSSATEPDKKFKTSAEIMAEVKREMAEAERKRREGGAGGMPGGDVGGAASKADTANVKAEQEAEEKRKKEQELAGRDPAGLVESTWQELLATGNNGFQGASASLGASGTGASAANVSDPKALQSLMSMLGQDSMMSGLPANGLNVPSKGLLPGDGSGGAGGSSFLDGALDSLPSADADTGIDDDLFDFIEASAAGPDVFGDTDIDLSGVFGSSALNASTQESEPPVETPELVASARLPGGSSNASTVSNSTSNSMRGKMPAALGASGLDFGSAGPSSTSPAEMSSCDEIDLEKSPFVHRMRLDRMGLTMAPAASGAEASKTTSASADGQGTVKAPEETAIGQVELGPGSQGIIAGSGGDDWWELDHFGSMTNGGFGSDANADQPWAVLS